LHLKDSTFTNPLFNRNGALSPYKPQVSYSSPCRTSATTPITLALLSLPTQTDLLCHAVISHLSIGEHLINKEGFQQMMQYIFTFIEKVSVDISSLASSK